MNNFKVFNETKIKIEEIKEITSFIRFVLKKEKLKNVEFNIIFIDNETIRKINREYRNKDAVTDVISFALEDCKDITFQDYRLLGDIYISLDRAKEQAIEYNHSLLRELSFLAIHGLLHLLGYDHLNEADEKLMFEKQKELLDEYGIKRPK